MKNTGFKRLLSVILSVAMVLSMAAMPVMAEEADMVIYYDNSASGWEQVFVSWADADGNEVAEIFDADGDGLYEALICGGSSLVSFGPSAEISEHPLWLTTVTAGEVYRYAPPAEEPVAEDPTEEPTEPEVTEEPNEPEVTEEPTEPEAIGEPTEPEVTEEPTEPEVTEEPTEPEVTEEPTEPEVTEEPTEPEATEDPTEPEVTEEPTEPEVTEEPTEPEVPEEPTEPEVTEEPTEPEATEEPTEPEVPEEPTEPEVPEEPTEPEATEEPTEPEVTEEPTEPKEPTKLEALETMPSAQYALDIDLPENDELFAGYADRILHGYDTSLYGTTARASLNAAEQGLYDQLKAKIETVAAYGGSTSLTVSGISGLKTVWTNTDLGVASIDDTYVAAAAFEAQFNTIDVVTALLYDCPFDLYWFDKLVDIGLDYQLRKSGYNDGTRDIWTCVEIVDLTFTFAVSADYQSGRNTVTSNVSKVTTARNNAARVVSDNEGWSPREMLLAYRDYICNAVSYDQSAANDITTPYGDPWQLISVFDGDSSTNVVCEGYSKAFQYLCDLSGLDCISVDGVMSGGTGAGLHMWNIVTLGGSKYLVDVTNCDAGSIGADTLLFLATPADGSVDSGYTFYCYGSPVLYSYGESTLDRFSAEQLTLGANGTCGANVTWTLADGVLTISGSGPMQDFIMDDEGGNVPWSDRNSSITSVVIEQGVTGIGSAAFCFCSHLTSITIPDSVTSIGSGAFSDCYSLTSIAIPNSVTSIGVYAFYNCISLTTVSYNGTSAQKNAIAIGSGNEHLQNATWHYEDSEETQDTLQAPTLRVTNVASTGKIRLSWNAVSGAEQYKVYRSTSKTGTYTLLTTMTGTQVTNSSVTVGTTYYYYVQAVSSSGAVSERSNTVSRTCDLPRPTVTVTNIASSGKPRVSWTAVTGATKYTLYIYDANGSLLKSTTTTGTALTHNSATVGTTYTYKVKALCNVSAATSAYSAAKDRTCDLAQPVLTATNVASSGKIRVSWNAVSGATKYTLYIYDADGNQLKTTTTTGTALTHNSAETGVTYTYKVKALCGVSAATSAFSEAKSRTCDLARTTVTVTNVASSGKPKVSWTKVTGATKYTLYIYDESGKQLKATSTTGTSLTHTSAVAGTTYTYKVKALCSVSAATSAFSEAKERTCDLPRPTVTASLNSSGKPVLTWGKVSGATKYTVYIYDADGTLLKTSSTTGTKLNHNSAASGTTYSYRVVAVSNVSAANSAKSTAVSVQAK